MKKGFTLIEMAVVLLIIGLLATIVLRNIGGQTVQARDTRRKADLQILNVYLAQYLAKQGQFPSNPDNSPWSSLRTALSSAGISVTLPVPPAGDPYVYYPCNDGVSMTNHFVLRATMEQTPTQAPKLYEGTYDSASVPSGWNCSSPAAYPFDCQSSKRYFCLLQ